MNLSRDPLGDTMTFSVSLKIYVDCEFILWSKNHFKSNLSNWFELGFQDKIKKIDDEVCHV